MIGDTEDFTQHADDLVTVERVRHDRAQRREPGVRGMVAFQIALGLNRDRHVEFAQFDCHRAQPGLAWAENRNIAPGIRPQIFVTGFLDPRRQRRSSDLRFPVLLQFVFRQEIFA